MAILQVEFSNCSIDGVGFSFNVDDSLTPVSINETFYLSGCTGTFKPICVNGCYIIRSILAAKPGAIADTISFTSYGINGCQTCNDSTSDFLVFQDCFSENNFVLNKSDFSPIPSVNDVFLLNFVYSIEGQSQEFLGCTTLTKFETQPGGEIILFGYTAKTDCQTCVDESPILYEVRECLTNDIYYIPFPSLGFDNHLVTFTNTIGLDQFCGIVGAARGPSPNGSLISDLGLYDEKTGNDCNLCLSTVAEKKKLINCLSGDEEIVWASVLYQAGDSTHLSKGEGCYEIFSGTVDPSSAITITELANYEPQENCEHCLECYGLIYDYQTCEPFDICVPTNEIFTSSNSFLCGQEIIIDSLGNLFSTFSCANSIGKYDLSTLSLISQSNSVLTGSYGIAIDETNGVICVTTNSNYVTFFDYNDLSQHFNFNINQLNGRKVYFDSISGLFYVTHASLSTIGNVSVFSATSYNTVSLLANFGNLSQGYYDVIRIGSNIYVSNYGAYQIEVYDLSYNLTLQIPLPYGPFYFTYDGSNYLYITTDSGYYIKLSTISNSYNIVYINTNCYGNFNKIQINTSTNRLFITDSTCNIIYEFDTLTDTLIKQYSNLGDNGISQVNGITIDISGNTWYGSFERIFQLGCGSEILTGTVTSNEYLQIGNTFFNYKLSACCEITNITSITDNLPLNLTEYPSMVHYQDCVSCTGQTHQLFYCTECISRFDGILVAPSGIYNIGDFVRSQFGNSDWLCFEIIDFYGGQTTVSFESDGVIYSSCEECESGATIGLTLINTNTLTPIQANVTLQTYVEITGFPFGLPSGCLSDDNGVCYQIVNSCPIDNVYPLFEPTNFYYNQLLCRLANRQVSYDPVSAGTEYFACQICCPCESGGTITSVTVPHPVWTGIYGNAVTLLDAVQLGGMNGLNN